MGYETELHLEEITVAPAWRAEVRKLIREQRKAKDEALAWIFHVIRLGRSGDIEFRAHVYPGDPSPQLLPGGHGSHSGAGKWYAAAEFARWLCRHCDSGRLIQKSLEGDCECGGWEFIDGRIRSLGLVPVSSWLLPEALPAPSPLPDGDCPHLTLVGVTAPKRIRGHAERLLRVHRRDKNVRLARFCCAVGFTSGGTLEFSCNARTRFETNEEPCDEGFVLSAAGDWDPFESSRLLCRAGFSGSLVQTGDAGDFRNWDFRRGRIRFCAFGPASDWERLRPSRQSAGPGARSSRKLSRATILPKA